MYVAQLGMEQPPIQYKHKYKYRCSNANANANTNANANANADATVCGAVLHGVCSSDITMFTNTVTHTNIMLNT